MIHLMLNDAQVDGLRDEVVPGGGRVYHGWPDEDRADTAVPPHPAGPTGLVHGTRKYPQHLPQGGTTVKYTHILSHINGFWSHECIIVRETVRWCIKFYRKCCSTFIAKLQI